ncbi:MAG: arylesterase [Acidobacteriota bacterium]
MKPFAFFAILVFLTACSQPAPVAHESARQAAPVTQPVEPDNRKVLLVFGDSISEGYGLQPGQSYPSIMQRTLDAEKRPWRIVNQGVSGDTTNQAAARIAAALAQKPSLVLIELGGNDGLRGLPLTSTRANLEKMITAFKAAGAQVVLAGMTLPPNYGADYIKGFEGVFKDLSAKYKVKLIPFLLSGMITPDLRYFQQDGIHPTADGAKIVAETALFTLRPLLK